MRHDILWLDIWNKILLQFGAEIISYKVKWASWGFNELKGSLTAPDKWKCHLRLNHISTVDTSKIIPTPQNQVNDDLIWSTYSLSPLMQSGQGSTAGGSMPTSVQLWKSIHSSKAGSQDHQLQSWLLPQNLWHPSASWVTLKSREYSLGKKVVWF